MPFSIRADWRSVGRHSTAFTLLALLMSCGGGGGDVETEPAASQDRARSQAFVPPGPVPTDAHINGMWSGVYAWPLISVHSAILPDGRMLTYGSDLTGLQTGHANYDIWDPSGAPDTGHMTLPNNT